MEAGRLTTKEKDSYLESLLSLTIYLKSTDNELLPETSNFNDNICRRYKPNLGRYFMEHNPFRAPCRTDLSLESLERKKKEHLEKKSSS